jgi:DNA-binding transcriptional LysR family regulator
MEVRQLQIFRVLAEELNFTRTAEKVHTVQSNVTAQIRALEEELGVPLFDRLGKRVTLTDAGRRFQPFAEQALLAMEEGQRVIQAGAEPSGPLRVGSPESILTYRLPPILRVFRQRFPHVELSFRPLLNDSLVAELETGKLDIVICMCESVGSGALVSVPLQTEEILLLAHASHPITRKTEVRPSDLAGQTLLLTETGCGYRNMLDRILALQNIRPGNIVEFSSVEALKQCVAAAMGIGLLPGIVVSQELRQHQFKALPWIGPPLHIATHILWHKDKWVSPAMAAFRDRVQAVLSDKAGESQPGSTLAPMISESAKRSPERRITRSRRA